MTNVECSKVKQLLQVTQKVVATWGFTFRQSEARVWSWPRTPPNAPERVVCWVHAWLLMPVPETNVAESKIVIRDMAGMIKGFSPEYCA